MSRPAGKKWNWSIGNAIAKELYVENGITIDGTMTFGDAAADNMTVSGNATFSGTVTMSSTVSITGTTTIGTDNKVQFRDTGIYLQSSADGQLDIVSDTTVAISGAITGDSSLTLTGKLDCNGDVDLGSGDDTINIGSGSGDAIDIKEDPDFTGSGAKKSGTASTQTGYITVTAEDGTTRYIALYEGAS